MNIVDTKTASSADQQKAIEEYAATGSRVTPGGGPGAASSGSGGSRKGDGDGMQKGFLKSAGGALYPDGSSEGSGKGEMEAMRDLLPSPDELTKIAAETDPNDFLKELGTFSAALGLTDPGSTRPSGDEASRQHAEQSIRAFCDPQAGERTTATPAGPHQMPKELPVALPQPPPPEIRSEIRPEHELVDSPDGNDVLVLRVKLPELEGLADAQVPASPQPPTAHLTSPPHPCLEPSSPNKSPDLE